MVNVQVDLGERSYGVHIAPTLDELLPQLRSWRRAVLVTDAHVAPLWGDRVAAGLRAGGLTVGEIVLPAGESAKTVATWARCVDGLLRAGADRHTVVVGLGGGVLGDTAGFAAATTLRGLPWVMLPTTLLAMVDASVGGKTAVNHALGKNLIGAFHQPSAVLVALETLGTLPPHELLSGVGEVLKAALLADPELLELLERRGHALLGLEPEVLSSVVARCVRIKADVVARDEREAGRRAILNAGHTVGHAIERVGGLAHGVAVARGLVAEARWGEARGLVEAGLADRIEALVEHLGVPRVPEGLDRDALWRAVTVDKKRRGDTLRVPLVVCPGAVSIVDVLLSDAHDLLEVLP